MEHHQSCINIAPPIVLEATVVETQKQHAGVGVVQSFGVGIITTGVEIVVAPNIDVIKRGGINWSCSKIG
jgi:hypothetical protein